MKKILSILLSMTIFVYADLSVNQIQKMVNKIHEKREGVKLITLESTKEPFMRLAKDSNSSIPILEKTSDAKLVLHAIVNGKAYINNHWLKIDDNILGYKLKYIGKRGVVLRNENHIKKLFLRKNRDNFIKLEER